MNWLKNLFKKKAPTYREVERKVFLPKLSQNTIIRLRNGETRHLKRVSDKGYNYGDGRAVTGHPETIDFHQKIVRYMDDLGNRVELHGNDIQEVITQPVVTMRDNFEYTYTFLELIT